MCFPQLESPSSQLSLSLSVSLSLSISLSLSLLSLCSLSLLSLCSLSLSCLSALSLSLSPSLSLSLAPPLPLSLSLHIYITLSTLCLSLSLCYVSVPCLFIFFSPLSLSLSLYLSLSVPLLTFTIRPPSHLLCLLSWRPLPSLQQEEFSDPLIFSPYNNTEFVNVAAYMEAFWGYIWPTASEYCTIVCWCHVAGRHFEGIGETHDSARHRTVEGSLSQDRS